MLSLEIRFATYSKQRGDLMRPVKEKLSITIDSDLLEKLKECAEKDERSLSQYINLALKQHIKQEKSKP